MSSVMEAAEESSAMPEPPWWHRPGRARTFGLAGLGLVAVYFVLVFVDARSAGNIRTGDTDNLVAGARVALDCVRAGDLVGCGWYEGSVQTAVFPYPLLQYLPATFMVWLGMSDLDVLDRLSQLSWLAVVVMLAAVVFVFRRRPRCTFVAVAALVGSSLTYQATSSFGEALAAAMVLFAVVAAIERRPLWVLALSFLATSGKETLGPFVLVLVLVCARDAADRWLPPKRLTIAAAVGVGSAMVTSVLFNVFRYAGVRNRLYLDPALRTDGTLRKIEYYAALWFSPSAGVVWFWPLTIAVLAVVGGGAVAAARRSPRDLRSWAPSAVIVILVLGFLAGLTFWFSPFGWITYGPRLAVPILPAAMVAGLHVMSERGVSWRPTRPVGAAVVVLGVLVSVPQYGAPWRWFSSVLQLISPSPGCPPMTSFDIYGDAATYYECTSTTMWRRHPQVLDETVALGMSIAGAGWLLAALGCGFLLLAAVSWPVAPRPSSDTPPTLEP